MKCAKIVVALASLLPLLTHAQSPSLLKYTVYTSHGIEAECSDFLGKTASAGAIKLTDFLIQSKEQLCPLESKVSVRMTRGSIQNGQRRGCVSTPSFRGINTGYSRRSNYNVNYSGLTKSMSSLSESLLNASENDQVEEILLTPDQLSDNFLRLNSDKEVLIIQVPGEEIVIKSLGLELSGKLSPHNIIWNFYEATSIDLSFSGVNAETYGENIGMPGTFFAPHADVNFNNVLITGALYSRSIKGKASARDCSKIVSGQINPACLHAPALGFKCK